MNKIKRPLIIFLFLMIVAFNFDVYAADISKACSITVSSSPNIKLKLTLNGNEKYGNFYTMNIGGDTAFCLDMGKSARTGFTYNVSPERVTNVNQRRVYAYYLANYGKTEDSGKVLLFSQIALWVYMEKSGSNVSIYDLEEAFRTAYYTYNCTKVENFVRINFKNPDFKCSTWLKLDRNKYNALSETEKPGAAKVVGYLGTGSAKKPIYEYLTVDDFIGDSDIQRIMNIDAKYRGINVPREYASAIMNQTIDSTLPDLYIWHDGNSEHQRLLTTIAPKCKEVKTCKTIKGKTSELKKYSSCDDIKKEIPGIDTCKTSGGKVSEITCSPTCSEVSVALPYKGKCSDIADAVTCDESGGKITAIACEEPKKETCDPYFEHQNCDYSKIDGGFYLSDEGDPSKAESCYFSKDVAYTDSKGTNISSVDKDLSTKYCDVKCWESFRGTFPGALKKIEAGTAFFWGIDRENGYFGVIDAMRYCSTTNIRYEDANGKTGFITDFKTNETAIKNKYDSYVAQKSYNDQSVSVVKVGDSSDCKVSASCPSGKSETTYEGASVALAAGTTDCPTDKPNKKTNADGTITCYEKTGTKCNGCPSGYTDSGGTCYTPGKYYGKTAVTGARTRSAICIADNWKNASGQNDTAAKTKRFNSESFDGSGSLETTLSNRKTALENQIENRKTLITQIQYCQSRDYINKDKIYTFGTTIKVNYKDPLGINRNIKNYNLSVAKKVPLFENDGQYVRSEFLNCTDTPIYKTGYPNCGSSKYELRIFKEYHWRFDCSYYFQYPASSWKWYTLKENSYIINQNDTSYKKYEKGTVLAYELGYGIPTGFKTTTKYYDISVTVTGFGNMKKQYDTAGNKLGYSYHFEDVVKNELTTKSMNYKCPYQVENKIYGNECVYECDDNTLKCVLTKTSPSYCNDPTVKGLDLVYRVIDMQPKKEVVFPGILGEGRTPGENWNTFINEHEKWFKNITNHDKIYKSKPIYSIDLTPSLIQTIRKDNLKYRTATTPRDPYTSYVYANGKEKIICDNKRDQTCASKWLSELISEKKLTGYYCNSSDTKKRMQFIAKEKTRYSK